MNKIILSVAFLLIGSCNINAQALKNGDFENWYFFNNNPNLEAPQFWFSYNMLALPNPTSLSIYKSTDAVSGSWALKMTKNTVPGLLNAIRLIDTIGYIPEKLVGYYKFHPNMATHDTVFAAIRLWNSLIALPITGDYNGEGNYGFAPVNDYTPFEIPIYTNGNPFTLDSLRIIFFYESSDTSTNPTGEFFLDNLSFVGNLTSVSETKAGQGQVKIYPNPTSDYLYIDNVKGGAEWVKILDVNGKTVKHQDMVPGVNTLNLRDLPVGPYWACFYSTEKGNYKYQFVKK